MESHYTINVARRTYTGAYRHYFATAPHSLAGKADVEVNEMVKDMRARFPAPEFKVEASYTDIRTFTQGSM